MKNNAPIGIFDSGLGGLTVVSAVRQILPNENIIYLGDTARVPYGDKSPATIKRYGCENAMFLAEQNVKLIIAACNTVSSTAMDDIKYFFRKKNIQIPVMGVVEAGVAAVTEKSCKNIAVIGTRATIQGRAYEKALKKIKPEIRIRSIACPLFAPIVEEGLANHKIAVQAMELYLDSLRESIPEVLLLGCTHYPLLIESLKKFFDNKVEIIDSAYAAAMFAENFLNRNSIRTQSLHTGEVKFFVTDSPENFKRHAGNFLGGKIDKITHTNIDANYNL
jgi:glutamate racemase